MGVGALGISRYWTKCIYTCKGGVIATEIDRYEVTPQELADADYIIFYGYLSYLGLSPSHEVGVNTATSSYN